MTKEGLRLEVRNQIIKHISKKRNSLLNTKEFTIISNNCWGGIVYESFNIIKQSPTVGLFFMADEYLKFLSKFPDILYRDIEFIDPYESKYLEYLLNKPKFGEYPIGIIDDVEIAFLHYHSKEEVVQKWKRRCERINLNNLIVKINDQNLCNEKHLKKFAELNFEHKLIFSSKNYQINDLIWIKEAYKQQYVFASQEPVISKKYMNLIDYINNIF